MLDADRPQQAHASHAQDSQASQQADVPQEAVLFLQEIYLQLQLTHLERLSPSTSVNSVFAVNVKSFNVLA